MYCKIITTMSQTKPKRRSPFKNNVLRVVKAVPYGKVVSYGQVALYAGVARAARQVGWILNQNGEAGGVPWWRVVNNKGAITIKGNKYYDARIQRKLLISEGVEVNEDFGLDIEKYRFVPSCKDLENLKTDSLNINQISRKIPYSPIVKRAR